MAQAQRGRGSRHLLTQLRLDVTGGTGYPAHLAGSYFPAADDRRARPVLVCLPGGTYTHRYFDLEVPGTTGYSFARYAASFGFPVVAIDMLGTGESSRPERDIDLADQATAAAAALAQLGSAIDHRGPFVGIGHSMGGYVAMFQQARHRSYVGLAILGTTNQHVAPLGLPADVIAAAATPEGRAAVLRNTLAAIPDRDVEGDRAPMLPWFHLDDVPAAVVAADTASTLTVVPRAAAAAATVPGIACAAAATIDVPVFLAYGDVDVSPEPRMEPSFFSGSRDITLFVLEASGHCHNMASTREVLWDRLLQWCGV